MMLAANDNSAPANAGALRFLSVCSGIEAASVAWPQWQAVALAEIEKFPSAVLAHHYPDVPNLGDFTKIDTATLGRVDIFCGGTPCQAFSVAGLRQSLDDARGNLSLEFVRLAHELAGNGTTDGNGLRNAVWENVPGVLSTKDNAFGCFLAGLVGAVEPLVTPDGKRWPNAGMVAGPQGRAAWRVLDGQFFRLAQRRKRVIVVADFGNGADPAAVLFEPESVRRDSPPSREAWQGVAPTISARTKGGGGLGADFDLDGGLVNYTPEIARCDATREGSSQDYESTTMVAVASVGNRLSGPLDVATAVNAHGGQHGRLDFESETFVCHGTQDPCVSNDTAFALGRNNGGENAVLSVALRGREGGATAEVGGDVATALRASSGGGDKPHVLTTAVRRLTPKECERLQGFPDNYTAIPWRGKPASECPDGPRYKALGNSWAVPKFRWLGKRIERLMPPVAANDNAGLRNVA